MIEMKVKNIWLLLLFGCPAIVVLLGISTYIAEKNYDFMFFIAIIMFLTFTTMLFGWTKKIILDEYGIKIETQISFLFITIYKSSFPVSWNAINVVDYWDVPMRSGFRFEFRHKDQYKDILIHSMFKNYKEGLKHAMTKLPMYRFSASAQKKLRKMKILV